MVQIEPGSVINNVDSNGRNLGSFLVNPTALICGRLVSRKADRQLSSSLLKNRLKQALAIRDQCFDHPVLPAVPETRYIKAIFAQINPSLYLFTGSQH